MAADHESAFSGARFGAVNWLGLWTLYKKEVQRYLKIVMQTVAAPVVSSLLFLFVFNLAFGAVRPDVSGIPVALFLIPGLTMMQILTQAFANTSSSLLMSKMQGNEVDFLMPPLSSAELTAGFVLGGMTRGLMVAVATLVAMTVFEPIPFSHFWAVCYYAASASLLLSALGVMVGIWADKFDHQAFVNNFILMPLAFLSGTFYSVQQLPPTIAAFNEFNPIFYLIDGFRYGLVGHADGHVGVGVLYTLGLNMLVLLGCYQMFRSGYKLKS